MKKSAGILSITALLFINGVLFAQKANERLLEGLPVNTASNPYDFKYDRKTGSFSCIEYKENEDGVSVVTPKGKSDKFFGALTYNALFDEAGNVYTVAYNFKNDSIYTYFLLKNADVVAQYDFINENTDLRDGFIYFTIKDKGRNYFVTYDIASGVITKGNAYDDIMLLDTKGADFGGHGTPPTYVSFTGDGKPYYMATLGDKKFLVIGGVEQKYYDDIDFYYVVNDKKGEPVYVAYEKGQMGDSATEAFVVQGTTEYKRFRTVYGPVIFDNDNLPVYSAGITAQDFTYPELVMGGNKELSKAYENGVNSLQFTPSGKLAFIGTATGKTKSYSYIVIDGKESKKHGSCYGLSFTSAGVPEYVESDGDFEYAVVGDQRVSDAYSTIPYHKTIAGKTFYIGTDFNRSAANSDAYYDGEKLAAFAVYPDEGPMTENVLRMDEKGNYLLVANIRKRGKDDIYQDFVYSNGEKYGPFTFVSDIFLYKGKPLFTGQEDNPKSENATKCIVYYNSKAVTKKYDNIIDFMLDEKTGTATFIGVRDNKIYYVEIKL